MAVRSRGEPVAPADRRTPVHQLARTGLAVAAVGALGAAFAAGVSFGSAGPTAGDDRRPPIDGSELRLVNADLRPAASCDELLRWYVDHGVERVTPYGWDYLRVYTMAGSSAELARGRRSPAEATSSDTGTNVQEAGVDEPDVVKTDGSLLVRVVDDSTLVVYDVTGAEPVKVGVAAPRRHVLPRAAAGRRPRRGDRPGPRRRTGPGRAGHPCARRGRRRPERAHGRARVGVRLDARHRPPARRRRPARGLHRAARPGLRATGLLPPRGHGAGEEPGRRPVQHHRRLAAARHDDRPRRRRNASSSSGATTSRSPPPTPGSARSRWSASTCTTRRPPTPPR